MMESILVRNRNRNRTGIARSGAAIVAFAFSAWLAVAGLPIASAASPASAGDWPEWGHDADRNMISDAKNLPTAFDPGQRVKGGEDVDPATTRNIKWTAKLGSQSYGNPTVLGGKVFVGTNNEVPRDPKIKGDFGVVMAFDEASGKFLWQLAIPKLGAGKVSDWEYLGICSSPTVEGNRLYLVTNRCEVVALDTEGMANGNDGEFKDEAQYMAGPGNAPIEPGPHDGDLIWRFDMREELGVFPHNITSCSVLVHGGKVFTATSNGVDWSHTFIPAPKAPALIALDQQTGQLAGEEASGIGERLYHANWASPAFGEFGGRATVVFGAGDGFCYGFDPNAVKDEEGYAILPELWRFDCNPPQYKARDGKPIRYSEADGPSEIISTPVVYNNKVYVSIGQDPEHGEGVGNLVCIDPAKAPAGGDITQSGAVWTYDKIGRTIATPSIVDGLLYIADYSGKVHCLDAETGAPQWVHDTGSHIWGSTLAADGKIYVGNEDGVLTILAQGKQAKVINPIQFDAPIYATPIVAGGVLIVNSHTTLYAIAPPGGASTVAAANADPATTATAATAAAGGAK